jgi:hypothetical protein
VFSVLAAVDPNGVERACDAIGVDDPVTGRLTGSPADPLEPAWLTSDAGARLSIVWPQGFSIEFAPGASLRNEDAEIVAAADDLVELQVPRRSAAGTFADPYVASGILFGGCYLRRTALEADALAVTVADHLRVRSDPRIGDDSEPYEPLLPVGTQLFVLDGPVDASGYQWFEVASVSVGLTAPGVCATDAGDAGPCDDLYLGWVAAASRAGEPWLAVGTVDCPPVPTDSLGLGTLPLGARLACFSGRPITVQARLVECGCVFDGGYLTPSWFSLDSPLLLIEPSRPQAPANHEDWLELRPDPAGRSPAVLPVGEIVEVVGMFDHPDARSCLLHDVPVETAGPPRPWPYCRFEFAVTSLVAVAP